MSRNNDVYQVLVTTGDQAIATTGGPGDLTAGKLGVFNADTDVAITAGTTPKEIYIAVGTASGPRFSAGQKITSRGINSAKKQDYVSPVNPIYKVNGYIGVAETEYAIRFEFENTEIYQSQGFVQYSKTYAIKTPCAPLGDDANEVTRLFIDAVNIDLKPQVTVVPITNDTLTTLTHGVAADYAIGDEILYADLATLSAYNIANGGTLSTGMKFTTIPVPVTSFNDVDLRYSYPRQTKAVIGLIEGFGCNGVVTTDTNIVYEQGLGLDVKRLEYMANGWKGTPGPYRTHSVVGVANNDAEFFAVETANYDCVALEHNQRSNSAWLEYENNMTTNIAIPTGGSTTYAELIAVLNPILALSGQEALS